MKKIFVLFFIAIIVWGCSRQVEVDVSDPAGSLEDLQEEVAPTSQPSAANTNNDDTMPASEVFVQECEDQGAPTYIQWCYYHLARNTSQIAFCQKTQIYATQCALELDKDKTNTIQALAAVCDALGSGVYYHNCYYEIAMHRNNLELCKKTGDYVADCILSVDKDKTHTMEELIAVCEAMTLKAYKEICYARVAIHRNEPSLCDKAGTFVCRSKIQ